MTARGEGLVVLGAGLAGLSAAVHAGPGARLFERDARVGGVCATDRVGGYDFDFSGHLLHLRTETVRRLIAKLMPGAWGERRRDARIRLLGSEVRYPIQANTYGLPSDVKARALQDYLAAASAPQRDPKNFAAWARASFGAALAELFFEPYNRKLWTVEPRELTLGWMGAYVPKPDVPTVLRGAFTDVPEGGGYNAVFNYPKRGGIGRLAEALAAAVPRLALNAEAVRVDARRRTATLAGLGEVSWRRLISTLPLPVLAARLERPPRRVSEAARHLRATSMLVVNLGIRRQSLQPAHWIYFPEEKFIFHRVGFPSNYGRVAPSGRSSLFAEVSLPAGTGWERRTALARRVRRDLALAGILGAEDRVEVEHLQYLPYAYVIYDRDRDAARQLILDHLADCGIASIGRWGQWEYSAMEDAILAGKRAAAE